MERQEPYIGTGAPPPIRREEAPPGRSFAGWIVLAVLVAGAGAAVYYFWPRPPALPEPVKSTVPAKAAPPVAQAPRNPIEETPEQPLPTLKESDGPVGAAVAALVGQDAFGKVFLTENLVRNIVATVDNLPRDLVSQRVSPMQPVAGLPVTSGKGAGLTLASANSKRYALHMQLVENVPTQSIVALYRRNYPLFQQAYEELGYPNGYFNDRVVEVIDHLLDTPEPKGPIHLAQPKVLYEFADPALEELSAGQKIMLRIGKENRERVKAKLREIRAAIAAR